MPESLKKLRIFAASPSDVANERAKLETVVESLKPMADYLGLTLEVVDWRAVVPDAGRPQQVIFDQLKPTSWDIFIGILWHRFGTPSGGKDKTGKDYLSGTEEEFKTAYELWEQFGKPRMVLYRCTRALPFDVDPDQLKNVRAFFKLIEDVKGDYPTLYQAYDTTESFEKLVLNNLQKLLIEYGEQSKTSAALNIMESVDFSRFITLPVTSSDLVNEDLSIYTNPPFGLQIFHDIPFQVENARISMADIYDGNSKTFTFQKPILGVRAVHFLINAGDGRKRYGEVVIGCIEFIFKDDDLFPQRFEIKLIQNVREWAIGNYITVTIDGQKKHDPLVDSVKDKQISHEAWRGTTSTGQVAVMDILKVEINKSKYDKELTAIRFTRDIPRGKYALDYFVSGITAERST